MKPGLLSELQLNCIPGFAINKEYSQRVAVAFDDQTPQIIALERGHRNVMDNLMTLHAHLPCDQPDAHVLKIWMVDPGVVIDKIILHQGDLKKSYLGPPESRFPRQSLTP